MVYNELLSEEEFKVIRVKKIYNFFKSNLGNRVLKAYKLGKVVYKELPFYTEISASKTAPNLINVPENEKVRLQGVIDLFFYEGDNVILVDYKTDYVERGKEDELVEKYRAQLEYYKEALEKLDYQGHSWKLSQYASDALTEDVKKIIELSGSAGTV